MMKRTDKPGHRTCAAAAAAAVWWCIAFSIARDESPIVPEREEIGLQDAMLVRIEPPGDVSDSASLRLAWMNPDGDRLHEWLERVERGALNLAEVFPGMRDHREVSYVQLFVNGRPHGAAVVIQPMLEPLVPRTVEMVRLDGTTYPRVTGWRTRGEVMEQASERDQEREGAPDDEDDEDEEEDDDGEGGGRDAPRPEEPDDAVAMPLDPEQAERFDRGRPAEEARRDPSRTRLGFRMYVERDVILETSFGEIRILLRPDHAPETAWHFRMLVRQRSYDALDFHRIVPMTAAGDPFVIQAGDSTGDGRGGPGETIPLEPSGLAHDFGVVSMARGDDVHSAGSQFFIALSREGTASLDGQYCAFGYVISGQEAILAIADVPLADVRRGRPQRSVEIHRAVLVDAPPRETGVGRRAQRVQRDEEETERDWQRTPDRIPR